MQAVVVPAASRRVPASKLAGPRTDTLLEICIGAESLRKAIEIVCLATLAISFILSSRYPREQFLELYKKYGDKPQTTWGCRKSPHATAEQIAATKQPATIQGTVDSQRAKEWLSSEHGRLLAVGHRVLLLFCGQRSFSSAPYSRGPAKSTIG